MRTLEALERIQKYPDVQEIKGDYSGITGSSKGLQPALVINGENDVLRDEGKVYALKLSEAGVPVTAVRYPTIHDFVLLNAITNDPSPRGAIEQASNMLKNALSH